MASTPVLSGREVIKILAKIGYQVSRKRGSHFRLVCHGRKSITIPDYRAISRGLFRKILRDANLSLEEFLKLS